LSESVNTTEERRLMLENLKAELSVLCELQDAIQADIENTRKTYRTAHKSNRRDVLRTLARVRYTQTLNQEFIDFKQGQIWLIEKTLQDINKMFTDAVMNLGVAFHLTFPKDDQKKGRIA
jgi:hypothetical protein